MGWNGAKTPRKWQKKILILRLVIAFSKTNNRITFFAVSHEYDFDPVGEMLFSTVVSQLNQNIGISTNVIKSNAAQIKKQYVILSNLGFIYSSDGLENGVPVRYMMKKPVK